MNEFFRIINLLMFFMPILGVIIWVKAILALKDESHPKGPFGKKRTSKQFRNSSIIAFSLIIMGIQAYLRLLMFK